MKFAPPAPKIIKKYGNRRLYDSAMSEYITLDQLAEQVRRGIDVRVIDAATGEDLTHPTLAQILFESRGAARLLSPTVLAQLIRLDKDALAEVLGRYLVLSIDWYLQAKQGYRGLPPVFGMPLNPAEAMARMFGAYPSWNVPPTARPATPWPGAMNGEPPTATVTASNDDVSATITIAANASTTQSEIDSLRAQIDALKASVAAMHPAPTAAVVIEVDEPEVHGPKKARTTTKSTAKSKAK